MHDKYRMLHAPTQEWASALASACGSPEQRDTTNKSMAARSSIMAVPWYRRVQCAQEAAQVQRCALRRVLPGARRVLLHGLEDAFACKAFDLEIELGSAEQFATSDCIMDFGLPAKPY